jgi:hypothetical protein
MVKFTVHYVVGNSTEQWVVWANDKNEARRKFYADFGDDYIVVKIV